MRPRRANISRAPAAGGGGDSRFSMLTDHGRHGDSVDYGVLEEKDEAAVRVRCGHRLG